MSPVKTLAWSAAAWIGLGMTSAHADAISRSEANRLWTMVWPAHAVSSYQAAAAPAPSTPAVTRRHRPPSRRRPRPPSWPRQR